MYVHVCVCMYVHGRGYASSFEWAGDYVDPTPRDSWGRKKTTIAAMDAVCFSSINAQFRTGTFMNIRLFHIKISSFFIYPLVF